jgi:sugar lactone lactonase YvrE
MAMAVNARSSRNVVATLAILVAGVLGAAAAEPVLFESRQLTPSGEYPKGIEGPAVDAMGNLFVPNFQERGTIGELRPGASRSGRFARLPSGSIGNGIRFDRQGRMYVADFVKHNVFVFEPGLTQARVYFHSGQFHQPNDLAIAADGTLYASDPSFGGRTGQVWRITRGSDGKGSGEVMSSDRRMGITNGIDLSPDGGTLYVGESITRELWAYKLEGAKLLAPRLVKKFSDADVDGLPSDIDGLRTDLDGRIFVTRISQGTVAVLSPDGEIEREIPLLGKEPTNLTFGGPDGKTVFVTQSQGGFIEAFRVERPGREPCLQTPGAC